MAHNQTLSVQLFGSGLEPFSGRMYLEHWTPGEARARARKKTLKIVGLVFGCSLIGTIVHILLLVILPTLFITFIGAFPMYMKWSDELTTCQKVDGICPACKKEQQLRPYLSAQFKNPMTVQCPECGQTSKAVPANEADAPAQGRKAEQSGLETSSPAS